MAKRMHEGGTQYGVSPEMEPYAGTGSTGAHMLDQLLLQQQHQKSGDGAAALAEAASPISSRPPAGANFDELAPGGSGFPDEEALAGEDVERGGTSGNRWPRQETLALLKIRSEMDVAFKEATLKAPLWEDVSRRLAEFGYTRSAKKCKEKFENVQKYYKRTKEGRAGRQDGKCYRFFSQLEALHSGSGGANPTSATIVTATSAVPISVAMTGNNPIVGSSSVIIQSPPISAHVTATSQRPDLPPTTAPAGVSGTAGEGMSFPSNTSSSTGSEEDELNMGERKRKRTELDGGGGSRKKMMAFLERLMKEVVEKQEKMLQRFIETMEKREQDRMKREEEWRGQEMGRLTREQEILAQERAISASRDTALIAFLQKLTGQTIQIVTIPAAAPPPQQTSRPPLLSPTPPQPQQQQQLQQHQNQSQMTQVAQHQPQSSELVLVQQEQPEMTSGSFDLTSSRWPKVEVLALINLRSSLGLQYQEAGPKGPLWEEISRGMKQLGYNRSAKRCKEKWENINKYFKKVKESKKKRPEDAKTCPYFHQLDALYSKKLDGSGGGRGGGGGGGGTGAQNKQEQQMSLDSISNEQKSANPLAILQPPVSQTTAEIRNNCSNGNQIGGSTEVSATLPIQTRNGSLQPSFFEEGAVKKPEDILKELMAGSNYQQQAAMNGDYNKIVDSDDLDEDDEDDDEDDEESEEEKRMAYKIQYQKPSSGPSNGQKTQANSLAMVQ